MAANMLIVKPWVVSRRTATRVTAGAISFSSSSHFVRANAEFVRHETGGIAARPRQVVDVAVTDRVGGNREHDRHGARLLQQWPRSRIAARQDDVWCERGQLGRMSTDFAGIGRGPPDFDAHGGADGPAQWRQRLQDRAHAGLPYLIIRGRGQQHAYTAHSLGPLRARRERPCRRAAEEQYELAASDHSITSSASASTCEGMSRRNAL